MAPLLKPGKAANDAKYVAQALMVSYVDDCAILPISTVNNWFKDRNQLLSTKSATWTKEVKLILDIQVDNNTNGEIIENSRTNI